MNIERLISRWGSGRDAEGNKEITEHVSAERRVLEAHMAIVSRYAKPAQDAFVRERGVSKFYPLLRNPGIAFIGKLADEEAQNPHLRDFFSNVIADPRGPRVIANKLRTAKLVLNNKSSSKEIFRQIEYFLECAVKDTVNSGVHDSEEDESYWAKLARECGMKHLGVHLFQPQGLCDYLEALCLELQCTLRGLSSQDEEKMYQIIQTYERLAKRVRNHLQKNAQEVRDLQSGTSDEVARVVPAASQPCGSVNVTNPPFNNEVTPRSLPGIMATALATIRAVASNLRP